MTTTDLGTGDRTMADLPWDPAALPRPTRDPARLVADMDEWGYCLIERAFTAEQVARVRGRLEAQAAAERKYGHHKPGVSVQDPQGRNQWVTMLINKGRAFQEVLHHPLISAVMDHVLGAEHVLSELSAHITRPGNSLLPLHTDQWWMPPPAMPGTRGRPPGDITRANAVSGPLRRARGPISPAMCANAMCMISDFSAANGATRLVPGSHLTGVQPEPGVPHPCPSVAAEGPAGTVVVWEGRTWHAAAANTGDAPRFGVVSLYAGPQVRTLQNLTLGTKAEVLDGAPPALLKLLGFKVWSGYGETGPLDEEFARPAAETIGELEP